MNVADQFTHLLEIERRMHELIAERDELLALVRMVVDGIEVVETDDQGAQVQTRLPKGAFGRIVKAGTR